MCDIFHLYFFTAVNCWDGDFQEGGDGAEKKGSDMRSRGLCLVPMDYTAHVANNNGADYWSSATMASNNHNVSSSATGY